MIALPTAQLQQQTRIEWIINATEFFIENINGNTRDDIDTGKITALECYFSGASAANAIYQGFDAARKRIIQRHKQ